MHMMDGADVDAHIKKKRAHKLIMAEAFNHNTQQQKNGLNKMGTVRRDRASSKVAAKTSSTTPPPS